MQAFEVPQERWVFKLAPHPVGKAQQAYAALNPDDTMDCATLKKAIPLSMKRATNSDLKPLLERRVKLIEDSLLGYWIW